ncbi:MAG: hypothetical protein QM768_21855 [Agriterribacter sp.]
MARSIQDIYDSMVSRGIDLATEAGLPMLVTMFNSTSRVAIWKILLYTVAFAWNALDWLHDLFRAETDDKIKRLKPGSAINVVELAKNFQYGYDLEYGTTEYNNTGLTEDQVTASKIVTYAAAVEQERGIRIKVAKGTSELEPLTSEELIAFGAYMERVKAAGIKLLITSQVADDLQATIRIFYNPLVLRSDGGRIDGVDNEPVQNALKKYLKNLPFNGLFVPQYAVDALQAVEGVTIVMADSMSARYGALDFTEIDVEYNPDSGYLRLSDLTITFTPHASI